MKLDNELVAIYHNMDYSNLRNTIHPYDEHVTPLRDWCEMSKAWVYNIYLDVGDRQALDELLEDAQALKFKKVIVMSTDVLGRLRKDIRNISYTLASYGVAVEALNRNKLTLK